MSVKWEIVVVTIEEKLGAIERVIIGQLLRKIAADF